MIADLCGWAFRLATSWLPPLPFGGADEVDAARAESPVEPAPAMSEALARARDALSRIEGGAVAGRARPRDARFRPVTTGARVDGVERLVARLEDLDTSTLPRGDRERLLGAARGLVARLER